MYHAKVMIVDKVFVSVGSANFGNRSFRLNGEANLNVYSREFEADLARSRQVIFDGWKRRRPWARFLEILCAPFRSQDRKSTRLNSSHT